MSRFDNLWYSLGGIAVAARDGFGYARLHIYRSGGDEMG
jgi:hypothetical protein